MDITHERKGEIYTNEADTIAYVDKPKGVSSYGVIVLFRKKFGLKRSVKIGHAGTLDPLASGLMILGVGKGTKRLQGLTKLDKTYCVDVLLGKKTTTGDITGKVVEEKPVREIGEDEMKKAVEQIIGTLKLPVPAFSAVRQNGVRLYKKARAGHSVKTPIRDMVVYDARYVSHACEHGCCVVSLEMDVASGVYVRSVVEAFGEILGVPATVKELRRTKVGEVSVEGVIPIVADKRLILNGVL